MEEDFDGPVLRPALIDSLFEAFLRIVAAYSLLAVGLMNSIMFPTIFSLACEKLGPRAADGSGIINVAICGGAIVPLLYGVVADATGGNLAAAMIIPIICYAIIAGFGIFARRPATA